MSKGKTKVDQALEQTFQYTTVGCYIHISCCYLQLKELGKKIIFQKC
jgi:hypothetical protein